MHMRGKTLSEGRSYGKYMLSDFLEKRMCEFLKRFLLIEKTLRGLSKKVRERNGESVLLTKFKTCFPSGSVVKNLPASVGDAGLIPKSGRFPGEGNGDPLQYPCLENPVDRGAWWVTIYRVSKSDTTYQLNNNKSI